MPQYRGVFHRWDGRVIVHRSLYDDPDLCRRETQFDHAWNGMNHPRGCEELRRYVLDPAHVEVVEADKIIHRRHGETFGLALVKDDQREAIIAWAWLLPRNGFFSLADLATEIRRSHDAGNPKTAHDLKALEDAAA